ncbi:HMG box domain-containing protein [Plasmodiophora brassicae]|nr:hypothetical protein PBRA_002394 [Plasmodiophora brassicae]
MKVEAAASPAADLDAVLERMQVELPAPARSARSFFIEAHAGDMQRWEDLDGEDRMTYLAMEAADRERFQKEVNLLTDRLRSSRTAYDLFCESERDRVVRDTPGASPETIANILSQRWFSSGHATQFKFECLAEQEGARREQQTAVLRSRLLDMC